MNFPLKHFIQEKVAGGRVGRFSPSALYHPYRDWRMLLISLFLVFVVATVIAGYIFFAIKSGDLFGATTPIPRAGETKDKANLESVVRELDLRNQDKARILESVSQIVDPS